MTTENKPLILQHFQDRAISAHNWTSFSPEKRGEQMIKDYSGELASDIDELKGHGVSDESLTDYKARYERYFSSYLGAKGNTFSVMITGGGNFPVRRHEKANRSCERHYEIFREWRVRTKKAIIRKAQPVKTFASELDRYRADLAGMQRNHELMKEGNKRIKQANKDKVDITQYLTDTFNIAPHMIEWTMKFGFRLTSNNANMKRVEGMIKTLEQKEAMKQKSPITNYTFEGGKMIINYDIDRIQIMFDSKPNSEELAAWKAKGLNTFNWSPSAMAWQRKITGNALYSVKRMLTGISKVD
jgi:hypothetical protein